MRTDRTVANNKPDSIMSYNKQGTCMSTDVAIPADRNVIKKQAEIIVKYKDLTIEIQRTCEYESNSDTGNNRATGTISKSLTQYVSNIPGKDEIEELQKPVTLCTAHKLGYRTYFMVEITLHVAKTVNTKQL